MIQGFADAGTERLWTQQRSKRLPRDIRKRALQKLAQLDTAAVLKDLTIPPSNNLELLKGDRAGQHSIRINDQWRICFVWGAEGPDAVEITDYH